ncbi:MAG TPA: GNAT family N-acetyltransferase [Steroidobacteraceae bacterium]
MRPVTESDEDFLRALFAGTRQRELACLPGGDSAQALFLNSQFHAQRDSYRRCFPGANHDIIEVDGVPAGRLYVDRASEAMSLVDITLLPEYRGRGIGTRLVKALITEAAHAGCALKLHVALSNPAQRLYQRLGFRTIGSDGMYLSQALIP